MKVVHATSVHSRLDTRILLKMCRSLARQDADVRLVVSDGLGPDRVESVTYVDVGLKLSRIARATKITMQVARTAVSTSPDIIHFHDPELIPAFALLGARSRSRFIFDAHEDVPDQILSKHYLPRWARGAISRSYGAVERLLVPRLDAVVAATPTIAERYRKFHPNVECIANYPIPDELEGAAVARKPEHAVCYVGGIGATRGIAQMVAALGHTRTRPRLKLGGRFAQKSDRTNVSRLPGWGLVDELGFLDRTAVRSTLATSVAGLVTLQPTRAYVNAYPVKLFEYMSAGLPVIASHFPLWRKIIEGNQCGICVDPTDPASIAEAIDTLVENPDLASRMGRNGRQAVETTYNWENEAKKLFSLYDRLMRESNR